MNRGEVSFEYGEEQFTLDIPSLQVSDPTSWVEVRDRLNDIPMEYAYWSSVYADLQTKQKDVELSFDVWFAEKYDAVCQVLKPSVSESAKKHKVIVENYDDYVKHQGNITYVNNVANKVYAYIKSLDMQLRGLQTIGSALKAEMNMTATGGGVLGE